MAEINKHMLLPEWHFYITFRVSSGMVLCVVILSDTICSQLFF